MRFQILTLFFVLVSDPTASSNQRCKTFQLDRSPYFQKVRFSPLESAGRARANLALRLTRADKSPTK